MYLGAFTDPAGDAIDGLVHVVIRFRAASPAKEIGQFLADSLVFLCRLVAVGAQFEEEPVKRGLCENPVFQTPIPITLSVRPLASHYIDCDWVKCFFDAAIRESRGQQPHEKPDTRQHLRPDARRRCRRTAQSNTTGFVPFQEFLEATKAPNSTVMYRAASRVKEPGTFNEMRRHVLGLYAGVRVKHSYVMDSNHFDCIPVEQQPSVRMLGLDGIATPPPDSLLDKHVAGNDDSAEGPTQVATQEDPDSAFDEFGNSTSCEAGTIPMRRVTLEEMSRFSTLQEFLQKGPDGVGRPADTNPEVLPASVTAGHKYSIMLQNVNSTGGTSTLNIWSPALNSALGQRMSLSQEWYVGGSGASTQTAEVGWQVLPEKYGTSKPVLFIYWTADNYTNGCYNMDCIGFVQYNGQGATLGRAFTTISTLGGPQYDFTAKFYMFQGNWWLAVNGTWIGYFPGTLYHGGQMTKYAQSVQFGSESVGSTVWPGEGSGQWATAGWAKAAYQRNMFYYDQSGNSVITTLTPYTPSPACYNTYGPFKNSSADWQVFFYLGGPGGSGC
jgi:hypothetical protein